MFSITGGRNTARSSSTGADEITAPLLGAAATAPDSAPPAATRSRGAPTESPQPLRETGAASTSASSASALRVFGGRGPSPARPTQIQSIESATSMLRNHRASTGRALSSSPRRRALTEPGTLDLSLVRKLLSLDAPQTGKLFEILNRMGVLAPKMSDSLATGEAWTVARPPQASELEHLGGIFPSLANATSRASLGALLAEVHAESSGRTPPNALESATASIQNHREAFRRKCLREATLLGLAGGYLAPLTLPLHLGLARAEINQLTAPNTLPRTLLRNRLSIGSKESLVLAGFLKQMGVLAQKRSWAVGKDEAWTIARVPEDVELASLGGKVPSLADPTNRAQLRALFAELHAESAAPAPGGPEPHRPAVA